MPTVAELIVTRLHDAGVAAIFGVPGGGGNLDLIEAAGRAGLPFVLTSTETGAAIAAIGCAEVSGRPGACLTTLGPGAASVVNGVACAHLERAPVIVFTDSYPVTGRSHEHQQLDQHALFERITKLSVSLADGPFGAVGQALDTLVDVPPGPVHLDCPGGLDREAAPGNYVVLRARPASLSMSDRTALDARLSSARRPLIIAGLGARKGADAAAIRAFCERRGLPAMVTYKAKGVMPDAHPWFAGVFTNAEIERPLIAQCDLIVAVGLDPVELLPRPWTYQQPVLYLGSWRVSDAHVPFAVRVVMDVPAALQEIDARLPPSTWDRSNIARDVAAQRQRIDIPAGGLSAQRVVSVAADRLARTHRVTVDAGAHMFAATMLWPVSEPNGMLISNGLSTMGFALPAAIGAAIADRARPVVALTGDGGLLMCAGELLTAARERLPIIVIVLNDASLSLIEIKQQQRRLPPAGVNLGAVDWPSLARSLGVTAWTAASADELARAIDEAAASVGPSLIEARIDRSNYGATLRAIRG